MPYTRVNADGSRTINRVETFVDALEGAEVLSLEKFEDVLGAAAELVKKEHPQVATGALNNARGDWYESLIALGVFEYVVEYEPPYMMVRLPNISTFQCENLYEDEISQLIGSLREVLAAGPDVSLISSNPDFVIVNAALLDLDDTSDGDADSIDYTNSLYLKMVGCCTFNDIVGYSSVKSGLRPDRRLQIAHEGSLMKALYRHIQTRLWRINAPGLRYFGIAGSCTNADREALKTVATHSIIDVSSTPESAVDGLFQVRSGDDLTVALQTILH